MQANQERPKSHKFKSDAPSAPAGVKIGLNLLKMGLIAKGGKNGVIITTVGIASRAQGAGLLSGDVIKAVDGTVVNSVDEVNTLLSRKSPEAQVHMTVQRGKNLGQVNL
jgi:S1-C subfamily serine protease